MQWWLLICAVVCSAGEAQAQQALVLSGGGSRGIAHAGVIEILEEREYDADIVVGTSMGAVVGALYAAGYSPAEIIEQLSGVEWRGMFDPTPVIFGVDRSVRYPMLTIDLDVAGLRFSRGLVGQWRINRVLAHLLFDANARSRGDFNRLPRQYRAIVADLNNGEAIAMADGDLALAARISMSVPGFFAPVEWQNRVLIDGGVTANLPTGFAQRLGAKHMVAVDVAVPPDSIPSHAPFYVIQRAIDIMQMNAQRDTVTPNALVLPDIPPGFSGANFPDDPSTLIELGRVAARRDLPSAFASAPRRGRQALAPPVAFAQLIVEAPDSALSALTRATFDDAVPGPYDVSAILRAIDRMYATGLVEAVWPRVQPTPSDDHVTLIVRVVGQPRTSLAVAAHFENDRGGRAWGMLDRFTSVGGQAAVMSVSSTLGGLERALAGALRVHFNRASGLALSTGVSGREQQVRFFDEDAVETSDVARAAAWVGLELPHVLRERFTTLSGHAEWIDVEADRSGWTYGPRIRWSTIAAPGTLVGLPFVLEAERRWGAFDYTRFILSGSRSLHAGPLQLAVVADYRLARGEAPPDVRPTLGDQHAVPGLRWGEQRGRTRLVTGVDGAYPIATGFVRASLRSGSVAPGAFAFDESVWTTGAQLGVIFPTPLGALDVSYGIATRGGGRFEVSAGQRF